MNKVLNAVEKNLSWFRNSGVMVPENGLWGVAERAAVKSNNAIAKILYSFPAWSEKDDSFIIEQRRADCNFQTAWLFLKADKLFPGKGYGEIGRNILDFLYFRSGLLERAENARIPANWNWSHIKRESAVWYDDESWCIFIQLKIAEEFPELDERYKMRSWALKLAESLYAAVTAENDDNGWRGRLAKPHWGALATMALAESSKYQNCDKYYEFCKKYFSELESPDVSEDAYALIGAMNCALKFDCEFFRQTACKYADKIIAKFDEEYSTVPSEHATEAPVGKEFADLIYTINWVLLGMREFSLAENGKYRPQLDKIIDLLVSIQDDSESLSFKGCWRGMYDVKNHTWNCGDMYEGGSGSIYTGWTNAPISLGLLFECIGKSFLGA